ncbi:MAG: hypothetical protein EOP11_07410 [Proteobacteria bacterium]|nr:MAG: hypothetical protein EOP11_07410 [Pseudomonadota bacterium]
MNPRRDGTLVSWWRYFLIFMGVSFNKVRAVHGLSDGEELALEAIRTRLRSLANTEEVRALINEAKGAPAAHLAETVWKGLSESSDFIRGFRKAEFEMALAAASLPRATAVYLSQASGEKIAFNLKPRVWNHFDQNVHRFPMAGKEYTEIMLKVPFDPDSEIRAVELGVPVLSSEGEPLGSLVAHLDYLELRALGTLRD